MKGWSQVGNFISDSKSFLFSLSHQKKLGLLYGGDNAIFGAAESGPIFGAGYDLSICPNSNILEESYSNLGITYAQAGEDPTEFLAGSNYFMTEEIEVYAVSMK